MKQYTLFFISDDFKDIFKEENIKVLNNLISRINEDEFIKKQLNLIFKDIDLFDIDNYICNCLRGISNIYDSTYLIEYDFNSYEKITIQNKSIALDYNCDESLFLSILEKYDKNIVVFDNLREENSIVYL